MARRAVPQRRRLGDCHRRRSVFRVFSSRQLCDCFHHILNCKTRCDTSRRGSGCTASYPQSNTDVVKPQRHTRLTQHRDTTRDKHRLQHLVGLPGVTRCGLRCRERRDHGSRCGAGQRRRRHQGGNCPSPHRGSPVSSQCGNMSAKIHDFHTIPSMAYFTVSHMVSVSYLWVVLLRQQEPILCST